MRYLIQPPVASDANRERYADQARSGNISVRVSRPTDDNTCVEAKSPVPFALGLPSKLLRSLCSRPASATHSSIMVANLS
jgi:hypothetical protein